MIKPTIGRVVLFNDGLSIQRVPALICYVNSDERINIGGFSADGTPFSSINVYLCQGSEECSFGEAEWMPYQKEQAKKHEGD